ncbi:MAG TPA: ATP-binding protein [Burkholderiales bacterium]|nr:ATP-binding protein [Burkholderiales bacterium]
MTLWPRSLLWRTVLLIALLLSLSLVAWLQLFRLYEREPRARQLAQQIVSIVNLTRAALITAQPSKRADLLHELSSSEGIRIYPAEDAPELAPWPERPIANMISDEVLSRLGASTRIMTDPERNAVWTSFRIDDDEYWVAMPRVRIERHLPWNWIGWGVLSLVLSLAGAYLIVFRINRPLRDLERAVREVGKGTTPQPLAETGPAEIRTLSRAFNQMAADLARTDAERALLLAGVSHDLRTPLSRMRLGVELLGGADRALADGMVQDIDDIDQIIEQFLDFARAEDSETTEQEGDVNAIVNAVCERYVKHGKNVRATLETLPPLPLKPLAFQRMITNLVDNALRYGGPEVEIHTRHTDSRIDVSVLDRGPGIPPAEAARMLQPFTRLDPSRSGGSGSGLGLAIVDRIARIHHGGIELLQREGGGTEARVRLPVA